MDHSAYKEMLSALLDGELHGAEREAALAHMEGCADCRAYFAELTAQRSALGDLEEFDAPEGFAAGVMARLHEERAPKTAGRRAAWRGLTALAACAAVVLLAVRTLPDALRMGGASQGAVADSASSAIYASPSGASGASAAPAEAQQAPAAPAPSYNYSYVDGVTGGAADVTMESAASEEEHGGREPREDDRKAPNAKDDSVNSGAEDTGRYAAAATDEPASITNGGEAPMAPLSRPEAWGEDYPVLMLSGEGAAAWLAENGWQGESGAWYADAAALRALPETLTALYSELSEDYDGAVLVELWEAEP